MLYGNGLLSNASFLGVKNKEERSLLLADGNAAEGMADCPRENGGTDPEEDVD